MYVISLRHTHVNIYQLNPFKILLLTLGENTSLKGVKKTWKCVERGPLYEFLTVWKDNFSYDWKDGEVTFLSLLKLGKISSSKNKVSWKDQLF